MKIICNQNGFKNEQIEIENFYVTKVAEAQFQDQIDCRDGRCLDEIKLQGVDSKDGRVLSCRKKIGALGYPKC